MAPKKRPSSQRHKRRGNATNGVADSSDSGAATGQATAEALAAAEQFDTLPDDIRAQILADPELRALEIFADSGIYAFRPRPDDPDQDDQQTGFYESKAPIVFCLGGSGSGKTEAAAAKTARFLLTTPAPRSDTPFWVISDSYDQAMNICWKEKLRKYLPTWKIDTDRIRWHDSKQDWPFIVPLMPDAKTGHNWQLEFRSYKEGRRQFQGRSIGGFWFSEQFPMDLLVEVLRGCRDHWDKFHGGRMCEFTPLDADMSLELEVLLESPPKGWEFYHLNSLCNTATSESWKETFFAGVSEEMLETRIKGRLASYEGLIFTTFNPKQHCVDSSQIAFPPNCRHARGIDWGESREHPFSCVFGYRDGAGHWWIYDEYWDASGQTITEGHAHNIRDRWPADDLDCEHIATYADPSRPGEINEFNVRGVPCQSARNSVDQGIECLRVHFKRGTIHIDRQRCKRLVQQLRKYRWERRTGKGVNPRAAKRQPLKWDDDLVDALRYMIFSVDGYTGVAPSRTVYRSEDALIRRGINLEIPEGDDAERALFGGFSGRRIM